MPDTDSSVAECGNENLAARTGAYVRQGLNSRLRAHLSAAAVAGGLSLAVYTLSHGLSANPDIAVNKAERESGEPPADREERAQEYHDSALFAKKVRS